MEPIGYELRPVKAAKGKKTGEWYFVFKAGNGEILFTSESYDSKENAQRGIDTVRRAVGREAVFSFLGAGGEIFDQAIAQKAARIDNIVEADEDEA